MPIKVAVIGAGSIGFTRKLMADILSVPELTDTEFAFHDISKRNLDMIAQLARRTGADHGAGGLMMAMRGAVSGGLYARPRCSMTPRAIPTSRTAAATCVTRSTSGLCMCV